MKIFERKLTFRESNCELCKRAGGILGYKVTIRPISLNSTTLAVYIAPNSNSGTLSCANHAEIISFASSMAACDGAKILKVVSLS